MQERCTQVQEQLIHTKYKSKKNKPNNNMNLNQENMRNQ